MKKKLSQKLRDRRGFTLMEMLIVVAIIAILIAIAIPTFSSQLEKAKVAADQANIRSAYAVAQASVLTNQAPDGNKNPEDATKYYMQKDGSFSTTDSGRYQIKAEKASVPTVKDSSSSASGELEFNKGDYIVLKFTPESATTPVACVVEKETSK